MRAKWVMVVLLLLIAGYYLIVTQGSTRRKGAEPTLSVRYIEINPQDEEHLSPMDRGAGTRASQSINDMNNQSAMNERNSVYPINQYGELILSGDLKHRFNYFLSLMGEFPLPLVLNIVHEDIEENLREPLRSQALSLFSSFIKYKYTISKLEQELRLSMSDMSFDLSISRRRLDQLRRAHNVVESNEKVERLLGYDEVYDEYLLSKLEILNEEGITRITKVRQIEDLEQRMPAELTLMRDEAKSASFIFQHAQSLNLAEGIQEELFGIHNDSFGIDSLLNVDRDIELKVEWKQLVKGYISEITHLIHPGMQPEEKQRILDTYKEIHFTPEESLKLKAYDYLLISED